MANGELTRGRVTTRDIVAKLWNLCNVLRDDGITYQDYVTELTFLLFLKMMQETGREDLHFAFLAPMVEHHEANHAYDKSRNQFQGIAEVHRCTSSVQDRHK